MIKRTVTLDKFQRELGSIKEAGWNSLSTWMSVIEKNRRYRDDEALKTNVDCAIKATNATKKLIDEYIDLVNVV